MRNRESGFEMNSQENTLSPEEKQAYVDMFWEKADRLGEIRQRLTEQLVELKSRMQVDKENLNLHEREELMEAENRYWEIQRRIWVIEEKEKGVEEILVAIENDKADPHALKSDYPLTPTTEATPELSKRKKAMIESEARFGISEQDIRDTLSHEYDPRSFVREHGSDPSQFSTGRRKTRIKGRFASEEEAVDEFFWQTTDTHGGKARKGKGGHGYVAKSGKRIRKK